jgi:hypothetical protein
MKKRKNSYKVPVIMLDNYLRGVNCEHIRAIKIDVEGYEYKVLLGAEKMISQNLPALILELQDHTLSRYGDDPNNIFQFLEKFGYIGYDPKSMQPIGLDYGRGYTGACNAIFCVKPLKR